MGARITSITGLQNLTNLVEVQLGWNSLTTVDLSGMSSLLYVDISDQNSPNAENVNYLTSVNLTGCTAIEELRLDDSDFSNGVPDISGLTELRYLDLDGCGITGTLDLSNFALLQGFDLSDNTGLTSVAISSSQPLGDGYDVNIFNCDLTQTAVNNILIALAENAIENGYVDLTGGTNAIPGAPGLAAKTTLEGKGWQVDINTP
jgi:hypothetical protein